MVKLPSEEVTAVAITEASAAVRTSIVAMPTGARLAEFNTRPQISPAAAPAETIGAGLCAALTVNEQTRQSAANESARKMAFKELFGKGAAQKKVPRV
jgi:hypothetical protein